MNELADQLAKEAANKSSTTFSDQPDRKLMMIEVKEKVRTNWQFRVNEMLSGHRILEINGTANGWKRHRSLMKHPMYSKMMQLITGHHDLNGSKAIISGESPLCACGIFESFDHFLFGCEKYTRHRFDWSMNVSLILGEQRTLVQHQGLDRLFGQDLTLHTKTNEKLLKATLEYIKSTKRFL